MASIRPFRERKKERKRKKEREKEGKKKRKRKQVSRWKKKKKCFLSLSSLDSNLMEGPSESNVDKGTNTRSVAPKKEKEKRANDSLYFDCEKKEKKKTKKEKKEKKEEKGEKKKKRSDS